MGPRSGYFNSKKKKRIQPVSKLNANVAAAIAVAFFCNPFIDVSVNENEEEE